MSKQLKIIQRLSEDTIKQATLAFLKSYYRYRPSLMENDLQKGIQIEARYDLKLEDDIVIDGYIAYQQRNGKLFRATFEATSVDKQQEVRYNIQRVLLRWDGLAIAASVSTILFTIIYLTSDYNLKQSAGLVLFLLYILSTGLLTFVYGWICMTFFEAIDRYHYIYAVEQFKRYHADEQWIAIGEDVFKGPHDPRLLELKDQCIKNGFGLIEVREDLIPVVIITPSRKTILQNRQSLDFNWAGSKERAKQLLNKMPYAEKAKSLYKRSIGRFERFLPDDSQVLLRYQRTYYVQAGITMLAFMIVAGIYVTELQKQDFLYEDPDDYIARIEKGEYDQWRAPELEPEDSMDLLHVQPFTDIQYDYLNTPEDQPSYILKKKEGARPPTDIIDDFIPILPRFRDSTQTPVGEIVGLERTGFYMTSQGQVIDSFSCNRILEEGQIKYIVQQQVFSTKRLAFQQTDTLATKGISANIFHTACVGAYPDSFVVFLDMPFDSLDLAVAQTILSMQYLQRAGFDASKLRVRTIANLTAAQLNEGQ